VRDPAKTPKPLAHGQGSTVALAQLGTKTLAYVADEDDQAVHVIDVDGGEVASFPLGARPGQLVFDESGRLLVAVRDASRLSVLEPTETGALEERCSVATDAEPIGLAVSPDGSRVLVATGWGRSLTAFDLRSPTFATQLQLTLPREPRSVLVSDDGTKAFVSHAVGGQVSIVDLDAKHVGAVQLHALSVDDERAARQVQQLHVMPGHHRPSPFLLQGPRHGGQGFTLAKIAQPTARVFVPQALVDTGDPRERPPGYGSSEVDQTEQADVAVLDGKSGELLPESLQPLDDSVRRAMDSDTEHHHDECLLPRGSAYEDASHTLYVACFGIDAVLALDALATSPIRAERRRWSVAGGPSGVAVDAAGKRLVVWSQFERTLSRIALGGPDLVDEKTQPPPPIATVALAPPAHPLTVEVALGRALFHSVGDGRISHDGRACASCHPDGRDDGLTWATPVGPRRSIMLAGRVERTAPFSWSGSEHTLHDHVIITFNRLKGDGQLRGLELDALLDYVGSIPTPPRSPHDESDTRVARGREIFNSKSVGCAGCHTGDYFTDDERHDVSTKDDADTSGMFNTPTLRFVGGTGPYFHDGRYDSLRALLSDGTRKMGDTSQLSTDDLEALEAYLRSI
jgi:mono/diheme cytochrome c family protein